MSDAPPRVPPPSPLGSRQVRSAARATPLRAEVEEGPLSQRLKAQASDAFLNLVGILRDLAEDFRDRDRFFKYKVFIIGAWLTVSVTSAGVACPEAHLSAGALGARAVLAGDASRPILMILNESEEPWEEVTVVVNGKYRASVARVLAHGNLTLTPKQLLGDNGLAPADLRFRDIELRTREGDVQLPTEAP